MINNFDVVVVGAGNAALCAALAARENNARVAVLERAPEGEDGGNSRFTAGAMRFAYAGVDDLKKVMPDLSAEEIANTDFGTYTEDQFFDDMFRVTQYRADPDLVELLVKRSLPAMIWMREKGVRFVPIYGRQAFKIGGKFKFWGGLTVEAWGGGPGLVDSLTTIARKAGIGDGMLCEAILAAENGLIAANLGGGVIKQRIARPGKGKSGGFRTLIVLKVAERAFFVHGFAKNEKDNLSKSERNSLAALVGELARHFKR